MHSIYISLHLVRLFNPLAWLSHAGTLCLFRCGALVLYWGYPRRQWETDSLMALQLKLDFMLNLTAVVFTIVTWYCKKSTFKHYVASLIIKTFQYSWSAVYDCVLTFLFYLQVTNTGHQHQNWHSSLISIREPSNMYLVDGQTTTCHIRPNNHAVRITNIYLLLKTV